MVLYDNVSNQTWAYNDDTINNLGIRADFEVIGSPSDTTPPVFESVNLSGNVFDISNSDVSFDVTALITDDLSGVSGFEPGDYGASYLQWVSPSGEQTVWASLDDSTGNGNNFVFREDVILPQYAEIGTWTLNYVSLYDNVSNHTWEYSCHI